MRRNRIGRLLCALTGVSLLAACQTTFRVEFSPDAQFVTKIRTDPGETVSELLLETDTGDLCRMVLGDAVQPELIDKVENVGTAEKPICEMTTKPAPISQVADPQPPRFATELNNGTYTVTWQGGGIGILAHAGADNNMMGEQFGSLTLEFAFPGPVQSATGGQIDGNVVRYTDLTPFSQPGKIVASAKESGLLGGKMPWWLLGLGGLAVVAVIAALALRRRPHGQSPTALGGYPPAGGPGGYPPPGYGPGGNAPQGYDPGTPPPAGPPPGYGQPPAGPFGPDQPPTAPPSQP